VTFEPLMASTGFGRRGRSRLRTYPAACGPRRPTPVGSSVLCCAGRISGLDPLTGRPTRPTGPPRPRRRTTTSGREGYKQRSTVKRAITSSTIPRSCHRYDKREYVFSGTVQLASTRGLLLFIPASGETSAAKCAENHDGRRRHTDGRAPPRSPHQNFRSRRCRDFSPT
jgi:hypothetical protein